MLVPLAKKPKLLVRDAELARVAQRVGAAILLVDNENLKALPAHGPDVADGGVHVFLPIVAVDDGVDLEQDAVLLAELRQAAELL